MMKVNIEKGIYRLLLGVVFIVPISSFISVRLLFLSLLLSLVNCRWNNLLRVSWDLIIFLLVLIVGLFYTVSFDIGFKVLETNFSFLAIPVIFSHFQNFDDKQLNKVFYFFVVGLFVTCSICLGNAIFHYFQTGDAQFFFFYQLTDIISSHPTYLAYYLIFAITFGLYLLTDEKPPFHLILVAFLIFFFFLVLLLTGGQTAFVSLLLVFSFFILKFFLGDRSGGQKLTVVVVVVMMVCMFFVSLTQNTERERKLNDSWDRFALWEAAIDANPNIFFGVGTGDASTVLNEYFRIHNLNEFAVDSLNSHNQFIQIYLSNGLIGLLALLLMQQGKENHPLITA